MEAGGSSDNQDGKGGRIPPDEQQMRLGRARVARGVDFTDEARASNAPGNSDNLMGSVPPVDRSAGSGNRYAGQADASDEGIDLGSRFRPWSEPAQPGQGPMRCPFLRTIASDGRLTDAQKTAVPTHRCAAFGEPLPLSLRQQELVCLQRVHVSCPRYVRGTLLANEGQARTEPRVERGAGVPVLTIAGIALVIVAVSILFGAFLGLPPLGGGGPGKSSVAAASASASHSSGTSKPSVSPTAARSATAVTSPVTSPVTSASPTAQPTRTAPPSPTTAPTSSWPPGATASRMDLLTPCTGQSNCYVYTVRGPGPAPAGNGSKVADTLSGIVTFFGVDLATVRQMNPYLNGGSTINPGDQLKIPSPTR